MVWVLDPESELLSLESPGLDVSQNQRGNAEVHQFSAGSVASDMVLDCPLEAWLGAGAMATSPAQAWDAGVLSAHTAVLSLVQ